MTDVKEEAGNGQGLAWAREEKDLLDCWKWRVHVCTVVMNEEGSGVCTVAAERLVGTA